MQTIIAAWRLSFLSSNLATQNKNAPTNYQGESTLRLSAKGKGNNKKGGSPLSKSKAGSKTGTAKLPRLIIFDLDGCLWKSELYELLMCSDGPPFAKNPEDTVPGTTLLSQKGQRIELLGATRRILYELYSNEEWYSSRVGISSRTDPPEWAHNLMEEFAVYGDNDNNRTTKTPDTQPQIVCQLKDVFDPGLCILDKTMDKATQFEMLLERANQSAFGGKKRLQFKDIVFFDNEAGNCKQVAKLGVTCVYTPKGVTYEAWQNAVHNFPSNRVLGPKMPY